MIPSRKPKAPDHPGTPHFIEWMYEIWQGIRDEWEAKHGPGSFNVGKNYTPEDLKPVFQRIVEAEVNGTLLDSTVELLTGGIMAHAFGNGNHRTSINATMAYLHLNGVRFPEYDSIAESQRWIADCNVYIAKSKAIRRKLVEFFEYDPGLNIRLTQNHRTMTREWLSAYLTSQSRILSVAGIFPISRVITSRLKSG